MKRNLKYPRPEYLFTDLHVNFLYGVVGVLVDDTLGFLQILLLGHLLPPIYKVSVLIELTTL